MLILLVCSVVYAACVYRTATAHQPRATSCTAVYLLVCIGALGVFLGGASFWAERYGLSTPLLLGVWAFGVARVAQTDHFFPLSVPARGPTPVPALPRLKDCFAKRIANITGDPNSTPRTAIVVAAAGGGIQASAWTAEVLTRLAVEIPDFEQSLCLVSGVSGGSVGMGNFLAGTYPPDDALAMCSCPAPARKSRDTFSHGASCSTLCPRCKRLESIRNRSRASLLEQVGLGMAFADLPRLFLGWIPRNRLVDRGWAIERLIDKRLRWRTSPEGRDRTPSPTLRDLCTAVEDGTMPVPLFNVACAQTGQRVIATPVSFAAHQQSGANKQSSDTEKRHTEKPRHGSRPLFMPEDFSAGGFQANPTLATVIRLSATFGYVSPVARPTRADEALWREAVRAQSAEATERFSLHFCDGGYADNSGVVSAVEACSHLLAVIRQENAANPANPCGILFIRIESFPEKTGQPVESSSGFGQMVFGPASSLLSARVIAQEERARRELEALRKDAEADSQTKTAAVSFHAITIRYGARTCPSDPAEPEAPAYPPLSWALSQGQQKAIEEEWKLVGPRNVPATTAGNDARPGANAS
jgi:hypothetical protein